MLGRLVKCIAIDPNFSKAGTGRRFITGKQTNTLTVILWFEMVFLYVRTSLYHLFYILMYGDCQEPNVVETSSSTLIEVWE